MVLRFFFLNSILAMAFFTRNGPTISPSQYPPVGWWFRGKGPICLYGFDILNLPVKIYNLPNPLHCITASLSQESGIALVCVLRSQRPVFYILRSIPLLTFGFKSALRRLTSTPLFNDLFHLQRHTRGKQEINQRLEKSTGSPPPGHQATTQRR